MKQPKRIASILLSLLLATQFGLVQVALADDGGSSPSPTPTPTDSPSPDPSASPSPDPSPDPSASPTPDPSASPSPSPSDSPAPKHHHSDDSGTSGTTGPTSPTGPQSPTGAQGCGGNPPKWVFDVASQKWQLADADSFTCDPTSGYYLSPEYFYNQHDGWYEIIPPAQVASLPSYFITAPNVIHTVLGDLVIGSQTYEIAKAMGLLGDGGIVIGSTGPGSSNTSTLSSGNQNWIDLTNLVNVINTLQSVAGTGNVTADKNTQVGNAVSGAASVMANLINLLASAWSWSNGNLAFFTKSLGLDGSNQPFYINPNGTPNGSGGQLGSGAPGDLTVNSQSQGGIVNNVDLSAQSGNVNANANTNAGNLASGNATAEINIMNLINSFIMSGSSFFGVLNIFNNYSGNIVFPDGFLNGLLTSGSGGSNGLANNSTQSNVNTAQLNAVNNNITTSATSGQATAADNTVVGQVSSGNATTTQNAFNLANTSIFGDNAVLVIVNVVGHWVGKIMNLAGGSTEAALLTGNASVTPNGVGAGAGGANASIGSTGPDSSNQISADGGSSTNINATSQGTIENNVNLNAKSGDASATENTGVGSVSTGNAEAASSVTNIFNSVLNVKHWFGVLVINVFGDWLGSVGDSSTLGGIGGGSNPAPQTAGVQAAAAVMPHVGLLGLFSGGGSGGNANVSSGGDQVSGGGGKVLTAAVQQPAAQTAHEVAKSRDMSILFILSAIVMLVAGALTSIDRKMKQGR